MPPLNLHYPVNGGGITASCVNLHEGSCLILHQTVLSQEDSRFLTGRKWPCRHGARSARYWLYCCSCAGAAYLQLPSDAASGVPLTQCTYIGTHVCRGAAYQSAIELVPTIQSMRFRPFNYNGPRVRGKMRIKMVIVCTHENHVCPSSHVPTVIRNHVTAYQQTFTLTRLLRSYNVLSNCYHQHGHLIHRILLLVSAHMHSTHACLHAGPHACTHTCIRIRTVSHPHSLSHTQEQHTCTYACMNTCTHMRTCRTHCQDGGSSSGGIQNC